MAKGSGRRRITPSDGLRYDDNMQMTNIEQRGGHHTQSASKELRLGIRTGASPTSHRGHRYGGKGRKDDNRNWKSHTKGKQYEHNQTVREAQQDYRPVPDGVAARMREKSINSDVKYGGPSGVKSRGWTEEARAELSTAQQKFMDKFGKIRLGERHAAYRTLPSNVYAMRERMDSYRLNLQAYRGTLAPYRIGFAKFEDTVRRVLLRLDFGLDTDIAY